jgi:hypothetical protein
MKYRKKPVVIEAVKYDGRLSTAVNFVGSENYKIGADCESIYIVTLEGDMKVKEGDYIIKGVQGEFYPCKSDIFEQTYEIVE